MDDLCAQAERDLRAGTIDLADTPIQTLRTLAGIDPVTWGPILREAESRTRPKLRMVR